MGSLAASHQRLIILDLGMDPITKAAHGRIVSCNTDGSDLKTIISDNLALPDGIVIDEDHGHMYFTNMGVSTKTNSGSVERSNLDGSDRRVIVPTGTIGVFTPKQIVLAKRARKLYWCDREGMKVMRCNLDGSNLEVLISTGNGEEDRKDVVRWCVGITVDEENGFFYWTQKGSPKGYQGRMFRARIETPAGSTPEKRPDVEVLYSGLPEPIDLELDVPTQTMYWTDRGDPPFGNTLNKACIGANATAEERAPHVLANHLHETIGLAIDWLSHTAYVTDLAGGVYAVDLESRKKRVLLPELGDCTGIALVTV